MNAAQILDAIARKHSRCALLREITVTDRDVVDPVRKAYQEWKPGDELPDWDGTPAFRRIDGLMLDGGGTRTAIEVKVSRSDFLRETDEKRRPWQRITNRFVYATPTGLLRPDEIPDGCGLWEIGEHGAVTIARKARSNKNPDPIPHQVLVALAYRLTSTGRSAA